MYMKLLPDDVYKFWCPGDHSKGMKKNTQICHHYFEILHKLGCSLDGKHVLVISLDLE